MPAPAHLLLVSEDQGNAAALLHAQRALAAGGKVTWICSTPTSSALKELEDASALKNTHMSALNLLVITRNEGQPFEVLTGALDRQRLERCAELLFDAGSVSEIAVAGASPRREELADLISQTVSQIDASEVQRLAVNADHAVSLVGATEPSATRNSATKNAVAVTVVLQGRELKFEMDRNAGTLLDGAEDAGLSLPFSCRGGVCSTCRARLRVGTVNLLENYALEDWELEAGFTLPCQAEPVSGQITLDYDEV